MREPAERASPKQDEMRHAAHPSHLRRRVAESPALATGEGCAEAAGRELARAAQAVARFRRQLTMPAMIAARMNAPPMT
jgi:hypothetical protein